MEYAQAASHLIAFCRLQAAVLLVAFVSGGGNLPVSVARQGPCAEGGVRMSLHCLSQGMGTEQLKEVTVCNQEIGSTNCLLHKISALICKGESKHGVTNLGMR